MGPLEEQYTLVITEPSLKPLTYLLLLLLLRLDKTAHCIWDSWFWVRLHNHKAPGTYLSVLTSIGTEDS